MRGDLPSRIPEGIVIFRPPQSPWTYSIAAFLVIAMVGAAMGLAGTSPAFIPIVLCVAAMLMMRTIVAWQTHQLKVLPDAIDIGSRFKRRRIPFSSVRTICVRFQDNNESRVSLIELILRDFENFIIYDIYADLDLVVETLRARMPDVNFRDERTSRLAIPERRSP